MSLRDALALARRSVQDVELYVVEYGADDYLVASLDWLALYDTGVMARVITIVTPTERRSAGGR